MARLKEPAERLRTRSLRISGITLLLCVLGLSAPAPSAAETRIVLGTEKPQESPAVVYLNLVYTEAFRRLGIGFRSESLPGKRSSLWSDEGRLDGELSRIDSYDSAHPNMVRVEEPHWHSRFIAIATNQAIQLQGWKSLQNTDYRVVYMMGVKGAEEHLPAVVAPENLSESSDVRSALHMLIYNRADIYVEAEMNAVGYLYSDEFKNSGFRNVGVLDEFSGHDFLHKRHSAIAGKLATVLRQMKKEGLLEKFKKDAGLQPYLTE